MKESAKFVFRNTVQIYDKNTNELLVDTTNDVHPQNMARVIAKALAHEPNSWIFKLCLGNGGTHIDSANQITYLPPITTGIGATLYNQTYEEQIDEVDSNTPINNSCISSPSPSPAISSIVTCMMELDSTEPNGQIATDNTTTDPDNKYFFDELCIKTADNLMLPHVIFSPIEKTAQRSLLFLYTLTISVA